MIGWWGHGRLLYLVGTDKKTNWIWGRIDLVCSTRRSLGRRGEVDIEPGLSYLLRFTVSGAPQSHTSVDGWVFHTEPTGATWVELKVIVTHSQLRTWVAADRAAKSRLLTCFNRAQRRQLCEIKKIKKEQTVSLCWYCTALMQHTCTGCTMPKTFESTVVGSGYRLPENLKAYGRTPHASQLIES